MRAARGRLEASSSGRGVGVVGARPAHSLRGALGSRSASVPACDLEQPPRSARCPLCEQDFRGTASRVTCGNFPPMAHPQPQRGEAPSAFRPSPPLSRPLLRLARTGPSCSPRAGHHPSGSPGWSRRAGAGAGVLTSSVGSFGFFCGCYLSALGVCVA